MHQVGFMPDLAACGSSDAPLAEAMPLTEAMPLGISGIRRGAPLTSGGLYRRGTARARCAAALPFACLQC